MTVNAEIAVLFTAPPGEVAVPGVMDFSAVEDADLHCWVSDTGQFEYCSDSRSVPLLGEASLEGRLWIGTLGRYWTPDAPEYGGHAAIYAQTLRSLARTPGVANIWYGVLTQDCGCSDVPAVTDEWITAYFGMAQAA